MLKWPDHPHYAYRVRTLGSDEHGVWGICEAGEPVLRGSEIKFHREQAALLLVPEDAPCFCVLWYPPDEPEYDVYVDITLPAEWSGNVVRVVDLDLDVETHRDGRIDLLDEDEFEVHQVEYAYPDHVIATARSSAAQVQRMISERAEPFGTAWRPWYLQGFGKLPSGASG